MTLYSGSPLTLSFRNSAVEERFQHLYFNDRLFAGRLCHLVAVFFFVTVVAWDTTVVPHARMKVWLLLASVVVISFLGGLSFSFFSLRRYERYWRPLFASYVLMTGLTSIYFTDIATPGCPEYNSMGLIFSLLFCYTFIGLPFIWASVAGNILVAGYIVTAFAGFDPKSAHMASSIFYTAGIDLLGMAVCYSQEKSTRRKFVLTELLQQNREEVNALNAGLENRVRKRTNQLEKSIAAFEQAECIAELGYYEQDWRTGESFWSKGFIRIFGERDRSGPPTPEEFRSRVHPDDLPSFRGHIHQALANQTRIDTEFRLINRDGTFRIVRSVADTIYDEKETPTISRGILQDVTVREEARSALKKIQDRLVQTQKMETVGRLAGGVAHDYNNMLSLIIGNAELAMEDLDPENPLYEYFENILDAAGHSEEITRQLLAFARKQTIAPRPLNLNHTVDNSLKLVKRLIGENINLQWFPCTDIGSVNLDPVQIDQILINLCTNARDAIKGHGHLSIRTGKKHLNRPQCRKHEGIRPGSYVFLSVSDDGMGMAPEVRQNALDPFFTTKGLGKGTGLGLSTVFGIVQQNGGFLEIESEPGQGSCITLYLPQCSGTFTADTAEDSSAVPMGNGETILLVEDESAILILGTRMLMELGYQVISANTPDDAIKQVEQHGRQIALLMTDVVMPGMNGRALADRICRETPGLPVLYMSGYTDDLIARHGVLDRGVCFMHKPFTKKRLAFKVKEALDGRRNMPDWN